MNIVEGLVAADHSILASCEALSLPRATYYRALEPATATAPRRAHPACLTQAERELVLAELTSERFSDVTIPEVHATLLDENRYLCSKSTMYRLLHATDMLKDRRRQVSRKHYPCPELLATAPNQVWSWGHYQAQGTRKMELFPSVRDPGYLQPHGRRLVDSRRANSRIRFSSLTFS